MRSPRWQLGVVALAGLLAAATSHAQAATQGPVQPPEHSPAPAVAPPAAPGPAADAKRGSQAAPGHRPQPQLRPLAALQHLQQAAARLAAPAPAARRADSQPTAQAPTSPRAAPLAERPAGAGRYVAAVVVCADADFDAAATLGVPRQDLLVLQTAGGLLDRDGIALLEHFAAEERLSLVVLVGHRHCAAQQVRGPSRAQAGLAARLRALRESAAAPTADVDAGWLPLQRLRESLLDASELLGGLARADQLRIVLAQHEAQQAIQWRPEAVSTLPLAPVR